VPAIFMELRERGGLMIVFAATGFSGSASCFGWRAPIF
jgi:hypothetical protein